MFRFVYFLLLLLCAESLLAQSSIKIKSPKREIRFVDLSAEENASFFRNNRELSKLVMDATSGLRLPMDIYIIDYANNAETKLTTIDGFLERISYPNKMIVKDYDYDDTTSSEVRIIEKPIEILEFFFPRDLKVIGLDMTTGDLNGKTYSQIHYVNFYISEELAKKNRKRYLCIFYTLG